MVAAERVPSGNTNAQQVHPILGHVELYDIAASPMEESDLKDSNQQVVEKLTQQLEAWKMSLPAKPTGDGVALDTLAIQAAIDECHTAGGGMSDVSDFRHDHV